MHVSVSDVNDNSPQFSQAEYNFTLSESSPIGTMVTVLSGSVTDADSGSNAAITFNPIGTSEGGSEGRIPIDILSYMQVTSSFTPPLE